MWDMPSFVYFHMESHYFLICVRANISWLYFLSLPWSPFSVSLITMPVHVSIVGWLLQWSQKAGNVRLHTFLMNSCFHYSSTLSYHTNIEWFLSAQHLKRSLLRLWFGLFWIYRSSWEKTPTLLNVPILSFLLLHTKIKHISEVKRENN